MDSGKTRNEKIRNEEMGSEIGSRVLLNTGGEIVIVEPITRLTIFHELLLIALL